MSYQTMILVLITLQLHIVQDKRFFPFKNITWHINTISNEAFRENTYCSYYKTLNPVYLILKARALSTRPINIRFNHPSISVYKAILFELERVGRWIIVGTENRDKLYGNWRIYNRCFYRSIYEKRAFNKILHGVLVNLYTGCLFLISFNTILLLYHICGTL